MTSIPILDKDAVRAALLRVDVQAVLREAFLALGESTAVQPPQTLALFPRESGDFITYLGVLADQAVFGAKLSPYIVTPNRPLVTAWTLLMSMETGCPLLLCDAGQLTVERTAATTALAVDLLARPDATTLTIIGAGAIARAHLKHALALRHWREVRVFSRTLSAKPEAHASFRQVDERVRIATQLHEAVNDSDVVMLCTSSAGPVLNPAQLTRPALITSISTNAAQAHEVPPASLTQMEVYCDYRSTCPHAAGEMVLATRHHGWSAQQIVADLPALLMGRADRPSYSRHAFFRSIGLGLEDVAIAHAVLTGTARE